MRIWGQTPMVTFCSYSSRRFFLIGEAQAQHSVQLFPTGIGNKGKPGWVFFLMA